MDTATFEVQSTAMRPSRSVPWSSLLLSAVLCVVVPISFWLAVITFAAWAIGGVTLSFAMYGLLGGAMALILVPVWASLFVANRA